MKILFIASRDPYPPLRGDQTRAYHLVRHLSQRHEVVLLAPVSHKTSQEGQKVHEYLGVRVTYVPIKYGEIITGFLGLLREGMPLQAAWFATPSLIKAAQDLLRKETFDIVHVQLARIAPVLFHIAGLPKVIDFIDALSLNLEQRAEIEPWLIRSLLKLEAARMRRLEARLIASTQRQIVVSKRDKTALGEHPSIHVIPNGVDIDMFTPKEPRPVSKEKILIFTGRMGYPPNAEAATYFSEHIWPRILRKEPKAQLWIVGADPPPSVRKLAGLPNVKVTGYVPHISTYLAQATVAIAPMRRGTGIQNKILEAMAAGVPVVTTPAGAEGLEAVPGEHLMVAGNEEEFAEQVVRLLGNPSLRTYLAEKGQRLVREKYSWQKIISLVEEVYLLAMQAKPKGSIG